MDRVMDALANAKIPTIDALDCEIVMNRDAHFGGLFSIMIEYYEKESKGIRPEFSLKRIAELARYEESLEAGANLRDMLLTDSQKEKVKRSQDAYLKLRQIFEVEGAENSNAYLIANLILAEEDEPKEELMAVVQKGSAVVDDLIALFKSDDAYDTLFPGYGFSPELAAKALGEIGDPKALPALFEKIGHVDFFIEDVILEALKNIGDPSKDFLLKILKSQPFSDDNQKAAVALVHFKDDRDIAKTAFELLKSGEYADHPSFLGYLIVICESLKGSELEGAFKALQNDEELPQLLRQDIEDITKKW